MSTTVEKGIIASPGIRIGKAYVYHGAKIIIPKYIIHENDITFEIARFEKAVEQTKDDLKAIQEQIARSLSRDMADIFTSHIMVLEDPLVVENVRKTIIEKHRNAEWAINDITLELMESLNHTGRLPQGADHRPLRHQHAAHCEPPEDRTLLAPDHQRGGDRVRA